MIKDLNDAVYDQYNFIDSVKYRFKIQELFNQFDLTSKTGITNFCICFCFRDNIKYFLSNMPDWAIEYHNVGGARSDEVFNLELMREKIYFIPTKSDYDQIQSSLVNLEEEKYKYFDTYSIVRRSLDCDFILLALHNELITNPQEIYLKTHNIFEDFCLYFINNMKEEIFNKHPFSKNLLIFNDQNKLKNTIKLNLDFNLDKITSREKECIRLIRNHYPPKTIAKSMNISEGTVRDYIKSIKSKLDCNSNVGIIEKAMMYGL